MGEIGEGLKSLVYLFLHKDVPVAKSDGSKHANATAAATLGQFLRRHEVPNDESSELATHEGAHADEFGGGTWYATLNRFTGKVVGAAFQPENTDDIDRTIRALCAPDNSGKTGIGMSKEDKKLLRDALRKKREQARNK